MRHSGQAGLVSLLLLSACASTPPKKASAPAAAFPAPHVRRVAAIGRPPKAEPPIDVGEQRRLFEQGEDLFSEERYTEAREAWTGAEKLGPTTTLGLKARRQIARVDAVLNSLKEIEAQ